MGTDTKIGTDTISSEKWLSVPIFDNGCLYPFSWHDARLMWKMGTDTIFRAQGNQGLVCQSLVSLLYLQSGEVLSAKNGCLS